MFYDPNSVQYVWAGACILTAALLLYAMLRASSRATRLAAWLSIGTVSLAIHFMMMAYAGETDPGLQRAGPRPIWIPLTNS